MNIRRRDLEVHEGPAAPASFYRDRYSEDEPGTRDCSCDKPGMTLGGVQLGIKVHRAWCPSEPPPCICNRTWRDTTCERHGTATRIPLNGAA